MTDDKLEQVERQIKSMQKHIRKQELRQARRKTDAPTSKKKPRHKDWLDDAWEDEFNLDERIMPRGEDERRKQVARLAANKARRTPSGVVSASGVEESTPERAAHTPGLVVEINSGLCRVHLDGDSPPGSKSILCTLRGNLRRNRIAYSQTVAVGDRVLITQDGDGRGVVEEVLPRKNVLARPDPMKGNAVQQIVVANVDQVIIVASWREPYLWPELIDRYLIAAQRNALEALIVVNKVDLVEAGDRDEFEATLQVYENLKWRVVQASTLTGAGLDELRQLLTEKMTVLAGLSGVGKSSLLMAIAPDLDLRVGAVSQQGLFTGQGRHTTTQSSLWHLDADTVVIDTPGIRDFGLTGVERDELASWYPEMNVHLGNCRFSDCVHLDEPDCAVKAAVERGEIAQLRYENYCALYACL